MQVYISDWVRVFLVCSKSNTAVYTGYETCLGEIHVHGFISYYSQRYTHWYITTVHYINFADLVVIHDCVEGLDPHGVNVPVQHDPLGVVISQIGEVSHHGGEQAWEEEHSVQPQHPPVQLHVQA